MTITSPCRAPQDPLFDPRRMTVHGSGGAASLQKALADQSDRDDFVRAFTLDGRALPPLLRVDDGGRLYGTADFAQLVLRSQRKRGQAELFARSDFLTPSAPASAFVVPANGFELLHCNPVPLPGLSGSSQAVAYARDPTLIDDAGLGGGPGSVDRAVEAVAVVYGPRRPGVETAGAPSSVPAGRAPAHPGPLAR